MAHPLTIKIVDPAAYTPPYDHALCTALSELGLKIELVTTRFPYADAPRPVNYRRTELFYRYGRRLPPSMRTVSRLVQHPLDMTRLVRALKRSSADIVHFQWLPVQPFDATMIKHIRQPVVITAHDVAPREARPGQTSSLSKMYSAAAAVVAHSNHSRQRLVKELAVDPAKIHVIAHGSFDYLTHLPNEQPLDRELAENLGDDRVILFFGLIRPYKGVDVLIDAFARMSRPAQLVVAGMPRMSLEPVFKQIEQLGLTDKVHLVPRFISDSEVASYFKRCDLVVLPYRQIEQSGVLYTALAFHKPTVLSEVGGFSEYARATAAARVVPADDPRALAEALDELLSSSKKCQELAEAASHAAEGEYSWQ